MSQYDENQVRVAKLLLESAAEMRHKNVNAALYVHDNGVSGMRSETISQQKMIWMLKKAIAKLENGEAADDLI